MSNMNVQIVDKPDNTGQKLIIEIDMETPSRKEEGAMYLTAKSGGFKTTDLTLPNGKKLVVNAMAGFYPDDFVRSKDRKK